MLNVGDLLGEFDLKTLAGNGGLRARVRGVQISDLLDPTPWLSAGELLLTSGLQLDRELGQREFVTRLAEHELAGVGLGTGFAHDGPPPAMVAAAEELALPLFEVPEHVPFIAIARTASDRMADDETVVLRRALASQDKLEQSMLAKPGLGTLVEVLSGMLEAAVIMFDSTGRVVIERPFDQPLSRAILSALHTQIRERAGAGHPQLLTVALGGQRRAAIGLPVAGSASSGPTRTHRSRAPDAWLVVVREERGLSELDTVVLRQAIPVAALELLRLRVARESARQTAAELLEAVVKGELAAGEVERRLASFGLTDTVAAIVVRRPVDERFTAGHVEAALAAAQRRESAAGFVAGAETLTCLLVQGLAPHQLFDLAKRIGLGVASELGVPVAVGVGRAVPVRDTKRSFDEARWALEARCLARRPDQPQPGQDTDGSRPEAATFVATFKDLGSFQLLLALQGEEALRRFCDSILGPIEAMESAYGGELLRSLQVFIEANGQWERAARQLYCHRHTLRYRIRKIEELTDRDLESASDRIEFYLALRARVLLA